MNPHHGIYQPGPIKKESGMGKFRAFISLGSNIGDKLQNIQKAVEILTETGNSTLLRHSECYKTEPVDYADQDWFVNAVIEIETDYPPLRLLKKIKTIEKEMGRNEGGIRFGPRIIDLDILFFDDLIIKEDGLTIPHPRLHQRRFVLKPICDIAPHLVHPVLSKSMETLLNNLNTGQEVIPV